MADDVGLAALRRLSGRRIAVLVSGSVAAYKACEVVSRLRQLGAEVGVAMTEAATRFVGPATFQALSGRPVLTDMWDPAAAGAGHGMGHLAISAWAEVVAVVPASADVIARLALGLADDPVTTAALAARAPLLLAPAMETAMWQHPATREHVATLRRRGATVVGPVPGRLASGHEGEGRMAEPEEVVVAIAALLGSPASLAWLDGRRIVVTAGGTREPIDPVRYIGNRSSGKMGTAIAEVAWRHGAEVVLVTTQPSLPAERPGLHVLPVETAAEMDAAVRSSLPGSDALVMAAAVADYRSADVAPRKIKKQDGASLHLDLVPTVDILRALRDDPLRRSLVVVGFAAETDDVVANARRKLDEKGLDLVVANDVSRPGLGMGSDDNAVTIIGRDGVVAEVGPAPKTVVAEAILAAVGEVLAARADAGRGTPSFER